MYLTLANNIQIHVQFFPDLLLCLILKLFIALLTFHYRPIHFYMYMYNMLLCFLSNTKLSFYVWFYGKPTQFRSSGAEKD
jgi:hypothetical protein